MNPSFWHDKRVLITGHTGFKGSWLALWLHYMGARVTGYALPPAITGSLYEYAGIHGLGDCIYGDVRDFGQLRDAVATLRPDIIFHLAAQAMVRPSYKNPVETYATNVMGTVHLLEAVRLHPGTRVVVNVTSDKCYENREWLWGYREDEAMGGHDPYSSSKGCAELVTASYRRSYFQSVPEATCRVAVATARAGNVIGSGDWAEDRLVPDIIRAFSSQRPVNLRYPHAVRPWQHVLDALAGYLILAENLWSQGDAYAEAWNFGPSDLDARPVWWIAQEIARLWGEGALVNSDMAAQPHEAQYLKLDCSKARSRLGWRPRLALQEALAWTVAGYRTFAKAGAASVMRKQIVDYMAREPI